MKFRKTEINDLLIAWIGIAFCFTIILNNLSLRGNLIGILKGTIEYTIYEFIIFFIISLLITGTSFICHELAHKYTAIYYKAKARFVMWWHYVVFAIFLSLGLGVIFIAPGAVYIYGKNISIKENGIISLAGPLINIIMAFLFFILSFLFLPTYIAMLGMQINLWIAFFNLLPIGPLDGKKIITWNPIIWAITIAIPLYFVFL
jgi:Zn-dependent protease